MHEHHSSNRHVRQMIVYARCKIPRVLLFWEKMCHGICFIKNKLLISYMFIHCISLYVLYQYVDTTVHPVLEGHPFCSNLVASHSRSVLTEIYIYGWQRGHLGILNQVFWNWESWFESGIRPLSILESVPPFATPTFSRIRLCPHKRGASQDREHYSSATIISLALWSSVRP